MSTTQTRSSHELPLTGQGPVAAGEGGSAEVEDVRVVLGPVDGDALE